MSYMEDLFDRFTSIAFEIKNLGGIVQNPMLVDRVAFDKWKAKKAVPLLIRFNELITDVEGYYFGEDLCSWCNQRHAGGPENCKL